MARYVVAVRRGSAAPDLPVEGLRAVPGVELRPSVTGRRAVIEATPQAIGAIRQRFGDQLVIEPEILHDRLR